MRLSDYKRDAPWVRSQLVQRSDGSVITKKEALVIFPKSWLGTPLVNMNTGTESIMVFAMFALMIDTKYMVFNGTALLSVNPSSRHEVEVDGVECIGMTVDAGSKLLSNVRVIQDTNLPYYGNNHITEKANKVPYFTKNDHLCLLISSGICANLGGLPNYSYITLYINHYLRQASDLTKLTNLAKSDKFVQIASSDIANAVSNNLGKVIGSYSEAGTDAILAQDGNPAENSEMDNILLMGS